MREYKFVMPLFVQLGKSSNSKKYYLSLNNYRNWHYKASNNIKKKFKENVKEQVKTLRKTGDLKRLSIVEVEYKMFTPDKTRRDKMNFISVASKFFMDALVDLNVIEDDNDNFVKTEIIHTSEIDRGNGRIEIIIREIEK